ncbi:MULTISPECIES: chemotaxis protein CheW [Methylobacterium]|uniref:Purine-binding chemotaxis protein CheW n=1 Tax=Methylobacterium pseudosasicola TaxID=582667 RepID=A0A1I4N1Y2_9HYPH|nr:MULTISPECIES: chemotaxis protein CheW [Methylobacterium]MCJ2092896.1 chemotaxis protein CheW [Methylobacterium sp. J-072]MCJ2142374.1 chemotaxis protein CheW [Methylobacterium sp. E-066]SFM09327.1 purine-binding chemotaxis protein CheW [Methylobacterium pseudosasicola]
MQAANANGAETGPTDEYVTVYVADTLFGLAIERVHDVFVPSGVTPVPLAPSEIVGLLNLRGRVVTAVCLRRRLGLPDAVAQDDKASPKMAIGLEQTGETFALVVDGVGEVLRLGADSREAVPINLDPRWRNLATCVHRLDGRLLVILDVDALLGFSAAGAKAA